ncbi:recombinase RecT [Bombella sp. ESL0385]|uniref:recombinase RecT n=1 Tax=Bombella sp. ESL0385 TaxID=2676446 RepID=UPI0012D950E4|nr:recombinase RecT [Bombella sp. ESL0385]MUG90165.1 hypothetical protein [Bombella sp. ESL0385]
MSTELTTHNNAPSIHASPLQPRNFSELMQFADMAARSGMVPKDYNGKPQAVVIACQMGAELGLAPMQSLQNIAVINGRPSVWGDTLLALVRSSPVCEDVEEKIEGEGEKRTAICIATRRGKKPVVGRFSVQDARRAGLWDKQGPWKQYPERMLQMRARGFALRDAFPDVLRGLITAEEAQDMVIDVPAKEQPEEKAKRLADELIDKIQSIKSIDELNNLINHAAYKNRMVTIEKHLPRHASTVEDNVEVMKVRLEAAAKRDAQTVDMQEIPE